MVVPGRDRQDISEQTEGSLSSIVQSLKGRDRQRMAGYRNFLAFYEGVQWERAARLGERRLTFNYARSIVEKTATYLLHDLATVADVPMVNGVKDAQAVAIEQALQNVLRDNDVESLDYDTEIDASILGDGCYRIVWDAQEQRVRITSPDVQGIFAWWSPADLRHPRQVAHRYQVPASEVAARYGVRTKNLFCWITEVWTTGEFHLFIDGAWVIKDFNPYGFIPYLVFPNIRVPKSFWGRSDLVALIEVQRELNRSYTQLSAIMEMSGNPITVIEGIDQAEAIGIKPGAVWEIPEGSKAYLLDLLEKGGADLHVKYIEAVYRALHDLSETPRTAFGDADGQVTGVALEIQLQPLTQKVQRKRVIRAPVYRQRNSMILRLLNQFTGANLPDLVTRTIWAPVAPRDYSRLIDDQRLKVAIGLASRQTAMAEVGVVDPRAELEEWFKEQERLAKLGEAASPHVSSPSEVSANQTQRRP